MKSRLSLCVLRFALSMRSLRLSCLTQAWRFCPIFVLEFLGVSCHLTSWLSVVICRVPAWKLCSCLKHIHTKDFKITQNLQCSKQVSDFALGVIHRCPVAHITLELTLELKVGLVTSFCVFFFLWTIELIFMYLLGRDWGLYLVVEMASCFRKISWKDYSFWLSTDSAPLWQIDICVVLFLDCFFLINVSIFLSIEVVTFQASDYWWGSLVLVKLSILSKVIQQQMTKQASC